MKKRLIYITTLTITFILASCAPNSQNQLKNGQDTVEQFQKKIKDIHSHSLKSKNTTVIDFQNKKTTMKQTSYGRTNHDDKLAFNIVQDSNHKSYKASKRSIFIDSNTLKSSPKTHYLNYNAKNAEIDFYQKLAQDWFDFDKLNQKVFKPIEGEMNVKDRTLSYEGSGKNLTQLYEFAKSQSPIIDQPQLSNINNLKVQHVNMTLEMQKNKELPKKLTFDIRATGKISNETINIRMKQTSVFYNFNNTKVKPYQNLIKNKYE